MGGRVAPFAAQARGLVFRSGVVAEGMSFSAVGQRRSAVQSKVQRGMKNEDLLRHGRQKVFLQGLYLGLIVVVIRFVIHNLPCARR